MENYDKDDAFFGIVGQNNTTVNNYEQIRKAVAENIRFSDRRIADSKSAKRKYEEQRKKIERENFIRRIVIAGAILSTLTAGIIVNATYGKDFANTNNGINILTGNSNIILDARGLASDSIIHDNDVSDYKKLNVSDIEDVYIYLYKSVLSRNENEKDDFIRSVSYIDTDGNKCYYSDFGDFLFRNGFENEEQFKDAARRIILEKFNLDEINELPYEGIGTVNRGGR